MADSDGFDWSKQQSLVVKRVDPIAVYKNDDGDIVVRQERAVLGVDALVTIPIQHAYSVIEAITRQLKGPFPSPPSLPPV